MKSQGFRKFILYLNPGVWIPALVDNPGDLFGWLGLTGDLFILAIFVILIVFIVRTVRTYECCKIGLCKCYNKQKDATKNKNLNATEYKLVQMNGYEKKTVG